LPGPGRKFSINIGPGSFAKKIKSAVRYNSSLKDNTAAIIKVLESYNQAIRRGGLSRLQKLSAWEKIKAGDKKITTEDARGIKKILSHLGKNYSQKSMATKEIEKKELAKKIMEDDKLKKTKIERNLKVNLAQRIGEERKIGGLLTRRDLSDSIYGKSSKNQSAPDLLKPKSAGPAGIANRPLPSSPPPFLGRNIFPK